MADPKGFLKYHRATPSTRKAEERVKDYKEIYHPVDETFIKEQLRDHFRYTGSSLALEILSNWEECKNRFTKIMPVEYKAALERRKDTVQKVKTKQIPANKYGF